MDTTATRARARCFRCDGVACVCLCVQPRTCASERPRTHARTPTLTGPIKWATSEWSQVSRDALQVLVSDVFMNVLLFGRSGRGAEVSVDVGFGVLIVLLDARRCAGLKCNSKLSAIYGIDLTLEYKKRFIKSRTAHNENHKLSLI